MNLIYRVRMQTYCGTGMGKFSRVLLFILSYFCGNSLKSWMFFSIVFSNFKGLYLKSYFMVFHSKIATNDKVDKYGISALLIFVFSCFLLDPRMLLG